MFEKKEEIETLENAETIVGASVKLKGNLRSDGNITINGTVSGDVKTKGSVLVGAGAEVRANIDAKNAVISGIVQGSLVINDHLSITETGKIYGDIKANILSIAPGAVFTGKCLMPEEEKKEETEPIVEMEEDDEGGINQMEAVLEIEE